ncbi:MAG: hypothetical protein HC933_20520 [Pleurocapsa sp. SU_196_0]|nr:hypothetical protein [Pleurocapsa sp. SU_196_0]
MTFTTWTTYIAEGVASSLETLETQVIQPDMSTPIEPLNDRQWLILSLLERPGSFMSNADAQRMTGATSVTAARDLAGLVQLGLVERRGQGEPRITSGYTDSGFHFR